MPAEGDSDSSGLSDDDPLLRAIARAPSRPLDGSDEVDPVRVAHFKITSRLGSGGMGVVYRAQDESLRREIALKLLPAVSASDPERRQRFLREARVAASLVHPNVAVVHQVGESDGRVYIAMELVDGVTLRQRLEAGPLPITVVRDLALQIAQGLEAAHAKGIVHRDLKPENVMVTASGSVKLLDFGLAKSGWVSDSSDSALGNADTEAQITREGDVLGSSAYMSPEQALGMNVDARSDVFSFGIVLYELITGRRPFGGKSLGEIRAAIAREQPVPLGAGADPGLAGIVRKCLEKRAEDRYGDAGVVALELAALSPASGAARRDDGTERPARQSRTYGPWLWSLAGALATVIAGALVAAQYYRGTPHEDTPAAAGVAPQAALDPATTVPLPYDDGGNPSKNPEAQRLYEEALAAFHGGTGQTRSLLLKAIELDPGFGAAQLRLTILFELDWTVRLRATVESEPSLSARDRALLSAIEPGFCPPAAHVAEAEKQADDLVAAHPRDEFVAWSRALFAQNDGEEGMCAYVQRIVTERPSFLTALAYLVRACLPPSRERSKQTMDRIDQCLRASPGATDCLASRVAVDERSGACADLDSDARRLLSLRPDSTVGQDGLANALAEQGAPIEAVRLAIGAFDDHYWWQERATFVPMLEGDFLEVERIADIAMKSSASKKDSARFGPSAHTLIDAYTESGDTAAAARIGKAALDGMRYLCDEPDWCLDTEAAGISAMGRGGRLTRSQVEVQLLDRYRRYALSGGHWDAWLWIYGENVRSPVDAALALTAYEHEVPSNDWASTSITLASAYMLAGRPAEARPIFDRAGVACRLVTDTRATMTEHLLRGRLEEQDGNKASACAHYAKILERWGHAKPRSVTADEARARSKTLGCPQP